MLKVNPTRMELRRLKSRHKTAVRGHKLLKDKSDEMVRQFMLYVYENKRLRLEIEGEVAHALTSFVFAGAVGGEAALQEAVAMPMGGIDLSVDEKNIMNVLVPTFKLDVKKGDGAYPYSFLTVTSELDQSIDILGKLLEKMVRLAEVEKTCNMLSLEIEKNRRRVNALEHVIIPEIKETIKYITMKLEENERGNIVRLMKVKEMLHKE